MRVQNQEKYGFNVKEKGEQMIQKEKFGFKIAFKGENLENGRVCADDQCLSQGLRCLISRR